MIEIDIRQKKPPGVLYGTSFFQIMAHLLDNLILYNTYRNNVNNKRAAYGTDDGTENRKN